MNQRALVAMAATASGGIGLLAIAWLATWRLTADELGFFFSFLSLGVLVQLADFGLSYAALQKGGHLAGTEGLHELPALARRISHWNLVASSLATIAVAAIGWILFSTKGAAKATSPVAWHGAWVTFLLGVYVTQLTAPGISLREGAGKVVQMWRLRLGQEWVAATACVVTLYLGGGLWSLSAFALARASVAATWVRLGHPLGPGTSTSYTWKRWMAEVWPFQWKIGLSGLSGFLIFRSFSPLILMEKGPVMAGQVGLSIAIMNLLIAVTTAWPMSQTSRWATLLAGRRFEELRVEFPITLFLSTVLSAVSAAFCAVVLWQLRERGFAFAAKFTEPVTTAIIVATAVVHHFVICVAALLRAEGREPLLWPSVFGGASMAYILWLTVHVFDGSRSIAVANFLCVVGGIPLVLFLLRRRTKVLLNTAADEMAS